MGIATLKTLNKEQHLDNEVIIQITKKQVINFLSFLLGSALITINSIAFYTKSLLMEEIITSQIILLMIFFIKTIITNNTSK